MNEKIDLQQDQIFIVLCAGILPKSERRNLDLMHFGNDQTYPAQYPWLLMVMLVQQHEGTSERLGIGYVEAGLWERAQPVWETVVLL